MAARRPQQPAEPLPARLRTLGAGSPRARPKLEGVFRCVEDAFENKTLQLDALGGRRDPRAWQPRNMARGSQEGPGEAGGDGPEDAAGRRERPGTVPGPQQVVAERYEGPGPSETPHTHAGSPLGAPPLPEAPSLSEGT